ncbi:o-spanin [Caulobacter phage BL198]|uniref:O-spanin n=1 Tax=Caulobacter phage BL198 TaxID=3020395 RepID=A0AAF0B9X8_9CAUD|nr:o-spanin [Caulobacter phage BL198]
MPYRSIRSGLLSLSLLTCLTACATKSPPEVLRVTPPAALMQPCPDDTVPLRVNGDMPKKIVALRATIACERADKASLREWAK